MVFLKKNNLLTFGLPLLIILFSVYLATSSFLVKYPDLAIGITYDLTLMAPLVYFLLIRKQHIPKITVVPVFVLGVVIASLLLPERQQFHLDLIKDFVLPIVELTVLSVIIYKVYRATKSYQAHAVDGQDFYTTIKKSALETLEKPRLASVFASEIAMVYYSLFAWKRKKIGENDFTNYKENGVLSIFGGIIFIVLAETFVLHKVLIDWNAIVTWILTGTSIYTLLQIFAHAKAMTKRPVTLTKETLFLRYGLFADTAIDLTNIDRIEITDKNIEDETLVVDKLALVKEMEGHNIAIHFKEKQRIQKIYGITKECDVLLAQIDGKGDLIDQVEANIEALTNHE